MKYYTGDIVEVITGKLTKLPYDPSESDLYELIGQRFRVVIIYQREITQRHNNRFEHRVVGHYDILYPNGEFNYSKNESDVRLYHRPFINWIKWLFKLPNTKHKARPINYIIK